MESALVFLLLNVRSSIHSRFYIWKEMESYKMKLGVCVWDAFNNSCKTQPGLYACLCEK